MFGHTARSFYGDGLEFGIEDTIHFLVPTYLVLNCYYCNYIICHICMNCKYFVWSTYNYVSETHRLPFFIYFPVALRPSAGHGLLILEVSRSHTTTHHSR